MPWLFVRWILEDRARPVAEAILVRGDVKIGKVRVESADGAADFAPEETPPPRIYLRRAPSTP